MKIFFDDITNVFWIPNDREAARTDLVFGRKYNKKHDRFEFPVEFITVMQLHTDLEDLEFDALGTLAVQAVGEEFKWWVG